MARGLLSGMIWGSVFAVGGAAVLSVTNPLPKAPTVAISEPEVTEPVVSADRGTLPAQTNATGETEGQQPAGPQAPASDTLSELDGADTEPTEAPAVGTAEPLAEASEPETQVPSVSPVADATPPPTLDTVAPEAPSTSEEVTISTEPAQPTPPPTAQEASGFAGADPAEDPAPAQPSPEAGEGTPTPTVDNQDTPPEETPAPQVAALPSVEPETPGTPTDDPAAPVAQQSQPPSPTIGTPVAPLTDRPTTSSLPSVGAEAAQVSLGDLPPVEQFAAPFLNPDDKPLMSIVLIDEETSIGAEALETFPYPLTFAIDPFEPDAAQKMARYRAAGFEVMALVDLPTDATAEDAETALEAGMSILNEAVGVLEGVQSGVQGSRPLSDQVTAILRDKGYGFVTQNSGLNTVQKLALRDGVPSSVVFRDFDGANQTPTVMRRFLDQAAFRAGQDGGVIMLGRVRPDTISALLLWGLQDRASRVALAPVSTVLFEQLTVGQ